MGWTVYKISDDNFIVWSSTVDAPITFACSAAEVEALYVEDAAEIARRNAKRAINNARPISESVSCNRAGPGDEELTEDEIMEFFVRRQKDPTKRELAEYRKVKKT